MMYLDLDELPTLFENRWFWSDTRSAIARFRRRDHLGPDSQPLSESVRDLVADTTGIRPLGPIRLLTHLSYFGYRFNPVSLFYCFAESSERVQFIVAEVNNTPWGEQNSYVLPCDSRQDEPGAWRFRPTKKMHVSPFMEMNIDYDWILTSPERLLSVLMSVSKDGDQLFNAALNLERVEISGRSLAGVLLRYPLMTLKVITAIHWQALRLWLKACPIYPHPRKRQSLAKH